MKTKNDNWIIAGPCSAETEHQLIETALAIKNKTKAQYLRAGIWKPRTNPGGFEGIGEKGLAWLNKAKQLTGLKTATEVGTPEHVELCFQNNIDLLWIGARTTVNPFSVQQLADHLKDFKGWVFIKNPVNPDVKLWAGAVERLQNAGVENIGLIHRGFTHYGQTNYRNTPLWEIAIEMKRLHPNLPLICDPSHICGNTHLLQEISQKSLNLGYAGLMIESHINPSNALTDKQQQVNPDELSHLLNCLVKKKEHDASFDFSNGLERLREQIDQLDEEVLTLLSLRMKVAKEIGMLKQQHKVTILQPNRYHELVERQTQKGKQIGLSTEFIIAHLTAVHMESIRLQQVGG